MARVNYANMMKLVPNLVEKSSTSIVIQEIEEPLKKKSKTKALHEDLREEMGVGKALMCLVGIFLLSSCALGYVYMNFPKLEKEEYEQMKIPNDIEDAKNIGRVLSRYNDKYYFEVLSSIFVIYIFLQTFAIPGSIFLSILSGYLFRWGVALTLICFCSATGATFCYLLSFVAGKPLITKFIPTKVRQWQEKIDKHRDNLFFYIVFLRITPFLPNWFINIASPVLNVPLFPFWIGTFIGVAAPSALAIQTGTTLYKLTSADGNFSYTSFILLGAAAMLSLVPVVLKKRLREKFD